VCVCLCVYVYVCESVYVCLFVCVRGGGGERERARERGSEKDILCLLCGSHTSARQGENFQGAWHIEKDWRAEEYQQPAAGKNYVAFSTVCEPGVCGVQGCMS